MEGSSDVEGLVGEVYEYLVCGKYGDGASSEQYKKKALTNKGELFYRKGKSSIGRFGTLMP